MLDDDYEKKMLNILKQIQKILNYGDTESIEKLIEYAKMNPDFIDPQMKIRVVEYNEYVKRTLLEAVIINIDIPELTNIVISSDKLDLSQHDTEEVIKNLFVNLQYEILRYLVIERGMEINLKKVYRYLMPESYYNLDNLEYKLHMLKYKLHMLKLLDIDMYERLDEDGNTIFHEIISFYNLESNDQSEYLIIINESIGMDMNIRNYNGVSPKDMLDERIENIKIKCEKEIRNMQLMCEKRIEMLKKNIDIYL